MKVTVESARQRWEAERAANGPLVALTLTTRVPSKWVALDRETGHRWEWRDGKWKAVAADPDDEQLVDALTAVLADAKCSDGQPVRALARAALTFLRDGG